MSKRVPNPSHTPGRTFRSRTTLGVLSVAGLSPCHKGKGRARRCGIMPQIFIQQHPIASVVGAILMFAIWSFPVWLATIWPLFIRDRTLPEWLRERGAALNFFFGSKYGWTCGVAGLAMVAILVLCLFFPTHPKNASGSFDPSSPPTKIVTDQNFENQEVVIDDYHFVHCVFTNVKLKFNGTATFGFTDDTFNGSTGLESDDIAITCFMGLQSAMGMIPPIHSQNGNPFPNIHPFQFKLPSSTPPMATSPP